MHLSNGQKLPKHEIVSSKKQIERIFREGKPLYLDNLKIISICLNNTTDQAYSQIFISVPKKKIKKAVSRNKLKRRIKEAYRKNKYKLNLTDKKIVMAIIYTKTEIESYINIEENIIRAFRTINATEQ